MSFKPFIPFVRVMENPYIGNKGVLFPAKPETIHSYGRKERRKDTYTYAYTQKEGV